MNKYENAKIYKLVNSVEDAIYIGSTCNMLSKRLSAHKSNAKKHPFQLVYNHLNNIGWDNVQIILIDYAKCNNREELLKIEREYIDRLKPQLNYSRPCITDEERKELFTRSSRQWRSNNTEKVREYQRNYFEKNKEKLMARDKQYDKKFKDERRYYCCDCDHAFSSQQDLERHTKSNKHHFQVIKNL